MVFPNIKSRRILSRLTSHITQTTHILLNRYFRHKPKIVCIARQNKNLLWSGVSAKMTHTSNKNQSFCISGTSFPIYIHTQTQYAKLGIINGNKSAVLWFVHVCVCSSSFRILMVDETYTYSALSD